jgi:hypothetical protein
LSKATGSARHPHDADRPESAAVRRALAKQDLEALKLALTPRQRAFAHEYIVDFNGSAAAIRAGYSKPWADRQAHILLKHKGVAFLIDHLTISKTAKATIIDPDYVLQRITEIVNKEGAKDGDKLRGLELLARHLGMLTDRTELTGKDGEAIKIQQQVEEEANGFMAMMKTLKERAEKDAAKKDINLV